MDFSAMVTGLSQARANQLSIAASATVAVYDFILTLPKESALVWRAPRTLVKYLYLFNRLFLVLVLVPQLYVMGGLSAPLSDRFCFGFWIFIAVFVIFTSLVVVGYLVLLRVYVLYKEVKYIKVYLGILWFFYWAPPLATTLSGLVIFWKDGSGFVYLANPGLCAVITKPPWIWAIWPWMISFQSTICALLIFKLYQERKNRRLLAFSGKNGLLTALLRDGIFYNAVILSGQIVNLVAWTSFPDGLFLIAYMPHVTIASLLAARIYLNLRDVATPKDWTEATSVHASQNARPTWQSTGNLHVTWSPSAVSEDHFELGSWNVGDRVMFDRK